MAGSGRCGPWLNDLGQSLLHVYLACLGYGVFGTALAIVAALTGTAWPPPRRRRRCSPGATRESRAADPAASARPPTTKVPRMLRVTGVRI